MTRDRLRQCLEALGWRTADLASMTKVSPVSARRWQSGKFGNSRASCGCDRSDGPHRARRTVPWPRTVSQVVIIVAQ
jgi:hypothetical protein